MGARNKKLSKRITSIKINPLGRKTSLERKATIIGGIWGLISLFLDLKPDITVFSIKTIIYFPTYLALWIINLVFPSLRNCTDSCFGALYLIPVLIVLIILIGAVIGYLIAKIYLNNK